MTPLTDGRLALIKGRQLSAEDWIAVLPDTVGGTTINDGIWRLYSNSWPVGGIAAWNSESTWKVHWKSLSPDLLTFGEDIFGNQLAMIRGFNNAVFWNHENGSCIDLFVQPAELLQTVMENGLKWLDYYADGSLDVACQYGPVPEDMHLHWIAPLIFGGSVTLENLTLMPREPHLTGHAELWRQVAQIPLGTELHTR